MVKWLLAPCLAAGLLLSSAGLQSAQAQFGIGGYYGGYSHYAPACRTPVYVHPGYYSGYRGYAPYGYGRSTYYVAPRVSVGRSSFYSNRTGLYGPYGGLGGFGNYGYLGGARSPGVQLRSGF